MIHQLTIMTGLIIACLVLLVPTASGQNIGLGPYQVNQELSVIYQPQLDLTNNALASWNSARPWTELGRFLDITATAGPLEALLRWWQAPVTRREMQERITSTSPKAAVVILDNQNWVGLGFLWIDGAWNANRFGTKSDRIRINFDQTISSRLATYLLQVPRGRELTGTVLHYGYVYYTGVGNSQTHHAEEVQFRFSFPYIEAYLRQQITSDQFLGSALILVKGFDEPLAQRIQLGTAPPPLQLAQPPAPQPPQVSPTPLVQPGPARAVTEVIGGREIGTLMVGDVLVFRITTAFENLSPVQRARVVAEKLNRLILQGLAGEEIKMGTLSNRPIILARDEILLAVDDDLARANGTSATALARLWVDKLKLALASLKR